MTDDLVKRLRYWASADEVYSMPELCREAADALEAKDAEIEQLRAELIDYKSLLKMAKARHEIEVVDDD